MESTLAAIAGVAAGFGLFFVLRIPLAAIPFTGAPLPTTLGRIPRSQPGSSWHCS